jgi:hypothetical protein
VREETDHKRKRSVRREYDGSAVKSCLLLKHAIRLNIEPKFYC